MEKRRASVIRFALLGVTLAGALWLGTIAAENEAVQNLLATGGYVGVFLFSLINGFNILIPIVTPSFVPALAAAGLDPYLSILVMTAGMTIADSVAFFLARAGRAHISTTVIRLTDSLVAVGEHRHWLPLAILFVWAFAMPLPNELMVIPLGLLGYRAYRVLPIVAVGNLVFNAAIGLGLVHLPALFV